MLIPIDEVVYFFTPTHVPTTGAVSDADSAPTFDVIEESTNTEILSAQTMTKRTSKTGEYRGTFTASAANGFEVGKWYTVMVSATVSSVTGKCAAMLFRCVPAETTAGLPLVLLSETTYTQPAQGTPPASATPMQMLQYLYKSWRNKKTNDGSDTKFYADDGTTVDHKQTTSESSGTVTKGEISTGP